MSKKRKLKKTLVEQILDKNHISHESLAINALEDKLLPSDIDRSDIYKTLALTGDKSGLLIGINNDAKVPVNKDKVLEAFKAVYDKDSIGDMSVYYSQYQALMTQLQARVKEREDAAKAESPEAKKNLEEGQAYASKMESEGYTKAPSGIVYKIDNPGTEPKVTPTDNVKVQYTGKNINGEVFDTNKDNVRAMRANGFVPGFQEALTMLGKGGKMTVVIPADQAYGLDGAGDAIGPNQTLVFDIEILDINPAK